MTIFYIIPYLAINSYFIQCLHSDSHSIYIYAFYQNKMDRQNNLNQSERCVQSVYLQQGQQQQCNIEIRDLDSGNLSLVETATIGLSQLASLARKASAWEQYWQEREKWKNQLIKIVNNNQQQKLLSILQKKKKQIDLNDFVYMDGWTLLHYATNKKHFNIVLILLNNQCSVNTQTQKMKRTCLHLAVLEKDEKMIKLLLDYNANPNAVDIDYCTPLHYATELGYLHVVQVLAQKYENLNIQCKNSKNLNPIQCCKDLRILNIIKNYLIVHCPSLDITQFEKSTLIDLNNGNMYSPRTRADLIQKILETKSRNDKSCQNQQTSQQYQICATKKSVSRLGSKMSKFKLEKFSYLAKQSLDSYKQSLDSNTLQSIDNYDILKQIGSGTFGTVFLIRKKKSSRLFALKRLSKKIIFQTKMKRYAFAERQILKSIKHPFILHGYSFFQDPAYLYMVMDFCPGGDLEKSVRKNKFTEEKAKKYTCQIVLAIEELHKRNYLFRDLKVANVLIDQLGHVKLADFGLAKQTDLSHSFLGSVAYLAPQMLVESDNKPHNSSIDWYLLGVFVYQMLHGLPPFYNENRLAMFEQIKKQKPKFLQNLSPECKDFLMKTLAKRPIQRLGNKGTHQIKNHSWFKGIDWTFVLNKGLQMQAPQIDQKSLRSRQYIVQQDILENNEGAPYRGWDFYEGQKI